MAGCLAMSLWSEKSWNMEETDQHRQNNRTRGTRRLLPLISAAGIQMLNSATFFCSMSRLWLLCSFGSQSTGVCVCVRACACMHVCVAGEVGRGSKGGGGGVAVLLQFSLSARFFNFTPHFPLMSFSHTHPLIFMGNRQAAAGLSVAPLPPAGMRDHRRPSSERTRGGGITNDSLRFSLEEAGKTPGRAARF